MTCKFLTKVCFNTCIFTAKALIEELCLPLPSGVTNWQSKSWVLDSGICSTKTCLLAQSSPWQAQAYHTHQRILFPRHSESQSHLKDVVERQGSRKVGCTCLGCCCCLRVQEKFRAIEPRLSVSHLYYYFLQGMGIIWVEVNHIQK